MDEYNPKSLPEVTAIEVLDLRQIESNRVDGYMNNAADAPRVRCNDKRAKHVAILWRELVSGEVIRCHIPSVGIRFFDGDSVVCEASVCWQCENIFGVQQGTRFSYCFAPNSTVGRELLLGIKELIGDEVLASE